MKKYHPCSKEFQEEVKRLGLTGNQYIQKLREDGMVKSISKANDQWSKDIGFENYNEYYKNRRNDLIKRKGFKNQSEYRNNLYKEKGYNDELEYNKERYWNKGAHSPLFETDNPNLHLGIVITEKQITYPILSMIFENIEEMNYRNIGFDFLCKNPKSEFIDRHPIFKLDHDKEYKIDLKSRRLIDNKWEFHICYNNITDYFLPIGFNNEYNIDENLRPLYTWLFKKDEMIRERKFWRRMKFSIINVPRFISQFKEYELKYELGQLKNQYRF